MTRVGAGPILSRSLKTNPELDSWVRINTDGTITLFTGKVEIGQGIRTAVAQIGAEELDVTLDRITVVTADTDRSPDEIGTFGSNSLEETGNAIRQAAADARQLLLDLVGEQHDIPSEFLEVEDGTVKGPDGRPLTTYWELFGGQQFGCQVTGIGKPKPPEKYSIVGTSVKRLDLPAKVTGASSFVHDMELPGMLHGRVVRPPGYNARLKAVDDEAVRRMPGVVAVVRDGSFLGVVAGREEQAVKGMEALRAKAKWQGQTALPADHEIYAHLLNQPSLDFLVVDGTPVEGPIPPLEIPQDAAQTLEATYYRPFHMHAALGPSAAMAQMTDRQLTVWTHSQTVHPLRRALAEVLAMAEDAIRVIHVEGPGCYGHNGADDAALDAALLARAVPGRPILLQWLRSDEHAWEPYGPAMAVKLQASLNEAGHVIDWNHDVWSYTHSGRPRPMAGVSNLLAAWHLATPIEPPPAQPGMSYHGGIHRNADPLYDFPRRRIVKHFVPTSPLRVSSLRSLGAFANVFAIESFMDELAHAAGVDPIAFRLRHLQDERARAVIEAAAEKAGWQTRTGPRSASDGHGRGIGFARYKNQKCYAAVIVDARVDRTTGEIQLERAVIAADAGQIVNPDGLTNQLEGGFIQAASWTLKEAVKFDQGGITSIDWESYPILRFPEVPEIETVLINRPSETFLGSGEATQGPTPAAIANAVFDATGVRLRQIPFTPDRVKVARHPHRES